MEMDINVNAMWDHLQWLCVICLCSKAIPQSDLSLASCGYDICSIVRAPWEEQPWHNFTHFPGETGGSP